MTQSAITTILPVIPAARPAPAVMYIPEVHSKGQGYFPERLLADMLRDAVINDIASAQHENVVAVMAVDRASGKCWDASSEIAQEVLNQVLDAHGNVPTWCEAFLETHLGIHKVRSAEYEYRHAA